MTRINFVRLFLAIVLASLHSLTGTTGEMNEEALNRELDRHRRRMNAVSDKIVTAYIEENTPGRGLERARLLLVVGSLYQMGQLGMNGPNPVRAAEYFRQAADMGLPEAHAAIGHLYNHGAESEAGTIEMDPERARSHYEIAAKGGSSRAMYELGLIYAEGKHVDPDTKKALEYFVDSAKRGDGAAIERLEPVMLRAREWEAAKPGRKANFPTSRNEIMDKDLVQRNIDMNFEMEQLAIKTNADIGRRLALAMKGVLENSGGVIHLDKLDR